MPEENKLPPFNIPAAADPDKYDQAIRNFRESFEHYTDDLGTALDKMTDRNKDIASFHEKLMLLCLGTIGISVSALISFVSKFPLAGCHRTIIISIASAAWGLLLIAAILCRVVISEGMASNQKILNQWLVKVSSMHATSMAYDTARIAGAFSGSWTHDGVTYDPKELYAKAGERFQASLESNERDYFQKIADSIKLEPKWTGRFGRFAIFTMQLALVLLAATAVLLFAWM
jgi:hypothetical protein